MIDSFRHWLGRLSFEQPLEQRQAGMLQVMLLIMLSACAIGLPLSLLTIGANALLIPLLAYPWLITCTVIALYLLRHGRFTLAVVVSSLSIILAIGLALLVSGLAGGAVALLGFAIPCILAGLMLGRRGIAMASSLSIALVVTIGLLETFTRGVVGFMPSEFSSPLAIATTTTLIIVVQGLFLDRFGDSLRQALASALSREHELEQLRASLEQTVAERTASLQQALAEVEQREARLAGTLEELRASQLVIRELSAPVIPVLPGVLVAPLIGSLDSSRAGILSDNILRMVERERGQQVIFDITGVPLVDTQVAQVLLQTAAAIRLLGAESVLVGIRPEVAQTIVALGLDLSGIRTHPNLREAIEAILMLRSNRLTS